MSRSGDPMAVGIMGGQQMRYFSIARWGDAKLTLDQVKRRLRMEKWMFGLIPDVRADSNGNDLDFFSCDIGSDYVCRPIS
jgi:hypothetical protein